MHTLSQRLSTAITKYLLLFVSVFKLYLCHISVQSVYLSISNTRIPSFFSNYSSSTADIENLLDYLRRGLKKDAYKSRLYVTVDFNIIRILANITY